MSRLITICLILFVSCSSPTNLSSQRESLEAAMTEYIEASNSEDYHVLIEFIPDVYFESSSKEEIIDNWKEFSALNPDVSYEIDSEFQIDTLIKRESNLHGRIRTTTWEIISFEEFQDEGGASLAVSAALLSLHNQYGKENVEFVDSNWTARIKIQSNLYSFKEPTNGWKIFTYDSRVSKLIPKDIRKH